MSPSKALAALALALPLASSSLAQQPRQFTDQDYAQAEKFMAYNTAPLASTGVVRPHWMSDNRFWYRRVDTNTPDSSVTFMLVDPVKATAIPAFDQPRLAVALAAASNGKIKDDPAHLKFTDLTFSDKDTHMVLTETTSKVQYRCELTPAPQPDTCTRITPLTKQEPVTLSPDKKLGAFVRNWNLWVRDTTTGAETQLTTDGVLNFGYATDNAGWKQSENAILLWSPDSKKIATFQQDQRKTGDMYLIPVTNGHPTPRIWKSPLVGDKDITMIERVVIDVPTHSIVRLKMPPDQHRGTLCDDIACAGTIWDDVSWNSDDAHLAFVSTSRDHRKEWFRVADTATGAVREVFNESVPKFFESGNGKVNWRYLTATNEILWFSERDNWGNLYLYDLTTGKLKNQITGVAVPGKPTPTGNVTQLLNIDEKTRTLTYLAVGKDPSRDPYYQHLYSIHFDGTGERLLTPANANHAVALSPDAKFFVDEASTLTQPRVTTLRRTADGSPAMELGHQDLTQLLASGWVPPIPITVKGRDHATDLYGFMFKPTNFDATKKYPIVNNVYPGPQTGSCGDRSFVTAHRDMQSLAELGFIVVCIDGMGTPFRSKSFHEAYYANLGDNTIPDQVSGMQNLARQYPFIDLDRVGMFGHSGGGNATAAALFHYPDFFKVGIAESGNHDERDYEDDWAEKWGGLLVNNPDGTSNYDSQANQNFAKNLKGHLLLAHGTMDDNVPPSQTLLVVDALIKANKDFDLLMIPNVPHGYMAATQYMTRRRWDYFVRYLGGNIPPHEYLMKPFAETQAITANGPADNASADTDTIDAPEEN